MRILLLAAIMALTGNLAQAGDFLTKSSPHSVKVTIDRLQAAVEGAGAAVLGRVDHQAAAKGAGLEMRGNTLIVFGNPKLGSPLMQSSQSIGLDLPLKAAAYENEDGSVTLIYRDINALAASHGVDNAEAVAKIAGALEKLTDKAVAAE